MGQGISREEIFTAVRECVADSLAIEAETVRPESRLFNDLGADSLDFVDIVFLLEKRFGVPLRESEFDFLSRLDFSSPQVMREGKLTPETVERLKPWLPELGRLAEGTAVTPALLFSLITIDTVCAMLARRLMR